MIDSNTEEWRPVTTHPQLYEISSHGNLRRRMGNTGHINPTPIWRYLGGTTNKSGHIAVILSTPRRRTYVHILVAEAFLGPAPFPKACVLHDDDVPGNNHLSNLEWGTSKNNLDDAVRNGRKPGHIISMEKTHCPRGHELVEPNLNPAHLRRGGRTCKACQGVSASRWGEVMREAGWKLSEHPEFQFRSDVAYAKILGLEPPEDVEGILQRPLPRKARKHEDPTLLEEIQSVVRTIEEATARRDELIRKAMTQNYPREAVAESAELSRARLYQILQTDTSADV